MRMLERPDPKLRGGCCAEPFAIGSKTCMQASMSAEAEPRSATGEAVIDGNHLRLIDGGPERLSELLALIDGAQISLKFYFYMFQSDDCGEAVMDRLLAALARGVNVALMVDCRSEEHTSELQSLMRISYAVFCLKKKIE